MKQSIAFLSLFFCLVGNAKPAVTLYPDTFREWLNDGAIESARPVKLSVTIPLAQIPFLSTALSKGDPKANLDTYHFHSSTLQLSTTKEGALAIEKNSLELKVTHISATSDLGTLGVSLAKIYKIRDNHENGTLSLAVAAKEIRDVLAAEFNLKRELSANDILALGVGLLDKELGKRIDNMVEKVRYGYASGISFTNEIELSGADVPPAETDAFIYLRLREFPSADGLGIIQYRRVAKKADAKQYILAAKLPEGYTYEQDTSSTMENPKFVLVKKP